MAGGEGRGGREKWVDTEIDDEKWEQGKNAADDDQIFDHLTLLPNIARDTQRRIFCHASFQGYTSLGGLACTTSKAKNKDTNTQGTHR